MQRVTPLTLALVVALAAPALADGDAAAGEKIFNRCKVCHLVDEAKNRPTGPHLQGVVGRKAGSVEGFRYSEAMAGSGLVWDEATLDAYLADPRDTAPGTRMAFAGLKKPEDRANVIAFLKTKPGP